MTQYAACRNLNAATKARVPLLLDLQSSLLADLESRVVAPMCLASAFKDKALRRLMPTVEVEGKSYVCLVPRLATGQFDRAT